MTSIKEVSLSQLKYASLGKLVTDHVPIDTLISVCSNIHLSTRTCPHLELYLRHQCSEKVVQEFTTAWLCNEKLHCEKYYVHDTHTMGTFFGGDLKPDFMVTTESEYPYGEFYVAFFIDVKAGDVHPWTDYCLGQAAAYCIRLLELSATNRRYSASCLVTNLHEAVVVNVERGKGGTWIYRKTILGAKAAIFRMFNAPLSEHGIMGRNSPVVINNHEVHLTKYLGSGASGIVYETKQKYAIKFFLDPSSGLDLKSKEKLIVDKLNANKPSSVLLQQVIDSDDEIVWPALLLNPVGVALSPISNMTFKRAYSFFSILETLKYAHSQGIIHNDIRPDNIVIVEGNKWLLIDWAAALELNSTEETKKQEYHGCVSYASDLVLTQLQVCHDLVQEDDTSYPYVIDSPSILSDLISLFRTVYVFAFRVSDSELNELMNLRAKFAFLDIITWWKVHLSEHAQDTETKLIHAFETDPHNIHDTAASLARMLFPEIN